MESRFPGCAVEILNPRKDAVYVLKFKDNYVCEVYKSIKVLPFISVKKKYDQFCFSDILNMTLMLMKLKTEVLLS